MSKYIEVESCTKCPYKGHSGVFGEVAYIPTCRLEYKTLGYTVRNGAKPIAEYDGVIPDWCPLPELN